MPKDKIEQPSENELIAYYLYPLLGGREQKLLQNILSLKNNRGELALIEDKHTACLANLFSLLYQYPPDPQMKETDEIIKIIDLVLKDCIPPYHLDTVNRSISCIEKSQLIDIFIEQLRTKNWPLVYKAIDLLQSLQKSYVEASQSDDSAYDVSVTIPSPWGKTYYRTDQETARNLGCITIEGKRIKINTKGMHCLFSKQGTHYKVPELIEPGSMESKYINCGREEASIIFQSIVGSPENVAPTTIIYMKGIPVVSPRSNESCGFTDTFLQASLTIEGICFKDLLSLIQILKVFSESLPEEHFKEVLQDAKNNFEGIKSYLMERSPYIIRMINYESLSTPRRREECEILREAIEVICKANPETQFRRVKTQSSVERARNEFYDLIQNHIRSGGLIEDIYVLIGLIDRFPILMKGKDIEDLLENIHTIKMLFELLPKLSAWEAYEELKHLMARPLFIEALSKAIMSSFIQPFGDGKSENVMVEITANDAGKIESFSFVRFDNDDNLIEPISMELINQESRLCLRARDILFFLPFMKEPVSNEIKQRLENTSPTYEILRWLSILVFKNRIYTNLYIPQEKLEKLGFPITLSRKVIDLIKRQWQTLKEFVKESHNATYEDCLRKLYPEIWTFYYALQARGFSNTFPPLPEDSSVPLALETVLYKYFSMGYCDLRKLITESVCDTVGENIQSLFQNAEQRYENINGELVEPIGFCLFELTQMNWTELDTEEAWQYVKIFSILPRDIAKQVHWQGKSNIENMNHQFQEWFNRAIVEGNPLVAHRMLQLGAKLNYVNVDTGKTALHLFCRYCLNYENYEAAELIGRILFSDPTCQPNHRSIEGPPIFSLMYATHPEFYRLNDTQKKILRYVIDCLCKCGVNLQAMNSIGFTLLDKALKEIADIDVHLLESQENIETWFVELVQIGAVSIDEKNLVNFWQKNIGTAYIKNIKGLEQAVRKLLNCNANLKFLFSIEEFIADSTSMYYSKKRSRRSHTVTGEGSYLSGLKIGARTQEPMPWSISPIEDITCLSLLPSKTKELISRDMHSKSNWCISLNDELEIQNIPNPERVGAEIAARIFCDLIMNGLTIPGSVFVIRANSTTVRSEKDNIIVWISPIISGENLSAYLEKSASVSSHQDYINRIAPRNTASSRSMECMFSSFPSSASSKLKLIDDNTLDIDNIILSTQIIIDIILGPRNNIPENFYVLNMMDGDGKKYKTMVRSNHYNAFSEFNEKDIPVSILFCLPYMRENIPSIVIELFLGRLSGLLKEWVQKLYPYDHHFKVLHGLDLDVGKGSYESLKSSFSLSKKSGGFPSGFYFKPGFIEEFVNRLKKLKEELQKYPNNTHLSLLKKLWPVSAELYQTVFDKYPKPEDTLSRFSIIRTAVRSESSRSLTVGVVSGLSLKEALEETKYEERILSCLAQLSGGSVKILESVRTEDMRKELFKKIFGSSESQKTISETNQKIILKTYIREWKVSFSELTIDCKILTDSHLKKILELSPDLVSLSLSNCAKLSENIFNIIGALEKLQKIKLTGFFRFKKISIIGAFITECTISNSLNLTHIFINSPMLVKGEFCDNAQLIEINLNSPHILNLNLSGCSSLTDGALINILSNCRPMPYLKIDQCVQVKSRLLHHISLNNPHFFSEIDIEELKEKIHELEKCLSKNELIISDSKFNDLNFAIEIIEVALKETRALKSVTIDFKRLPNDEQKRKIIASLERWIKKIIVLDLGSIKLNKEEWRQLYHALLKAESIEALRLSFFDKEIFPYFTSYLQTHSKMHSFIVKYGNREIDFVKRSGELLELKNDRAWIFHPSLVTDDDIILIASLLTDSTDTFFCSFSGIEISTEMFCILLNALEDNTALRVLDFHRCKLQEENIAYLRHFLLQNKTIFFINLDLNYFSEKSMKIILEQLIDRDINVSLEIYQYLEKTAPICHDGDFHNKIMPIDRLTMQLYNRDRSEMNWPVLKFMGSNFNDFLRMKFDCLVSYSEPVLAMTYLFDTYVASASGLIVTIWDINTKKSICSLKKHMDTVTVLLYLKDGFFVSGAKDGSIIIWLKQHHRNEATVFKALKCHTSPITAIVSMDGIMASTSEDGVLNFWDIEQIFSLICINPVNPAPIKISDEGIFATKMLSISLGELTLFLLGCNDGSIQVWKRQTLQEFYAEKVDTLLKHKNPISALTTFSLKPELFIAIDFNNIITVWEYCEKKDLKCGRAYECKEILMKKSIESVSSFYGLPSFFSEANAFISGGVGGISVWENYNPKNLVSYIHPVNIIVQLPAGQFMIGAHDIRILSNVFIHEEKPFDISFAMKYKKASIFYEKSLVKVVFDGVNDAKEYAELHQFILNIFYLCYARNSSWDDMKQTILVKDGGLYINCFDEKFAMELYHFLFALFKPENMVQNFLRFKKEKHTPSTTPRWLLMDDILSSPSKKRSVSSLFSSPLMERQAPIPISSPPSAHPLRNIPSSSPLRSSTSRLPLSPLFQNTSSSSKMAENPPSPPITAGSSSSTLALSQSPSSMFRRPPTKSVALPLALPPESLSSSSTHSSGFLNGRAAYSGSNPDISRFRHNSKMGPTFPK